MTDPVDSHQSSLIIFVVGTVGALAPEVIRLYALRHQPFRERFSPFYYVISALYALLGGFIAVILPAVTLYGAFYAGVTAPVTITTIARRKPRRAMAINSADPLAGMHTSNAAAPESPRERRTWSDLIHTHARALLP